MLTPGRFEMALSFTLTQEGGFVNDPADPGGATNHGITQQTYDEWRGAHRWPLRAVRAIEISEVSEIYRQYYWAPVCHALLEPLDVAAFDTAVNCGVSRCNDWLAHIPIESPPERTAMLLHRRLTHYDRLIERRPEMVKFLKGWTNRVYALASLLGVTL